jgi:ABC-type multidrug transport system permease subunit
MAFLMGTTWWRMSLDQKTVQDRLSAIFFTIAFLAFMSVAGIPALLEERLVFYKERANRLYSVGPYVLANTLVSIPFVLLISVAFTVPAYYMIGLNSASSGNFFIFLSYLWLALYVAESFVILIASIGKSQLLYTVTTLVSNFSKLPTNPSFKNLVYCNINGYFGISPHLCCRSRTRFLLQWVRNGDPRILCPT